MCRYNLAESPCNDCLLHFCCEPCAVCQVWPFILHPAVQKFDPSSFPFCLWLTAENAHNILFHKKLRLMKKMHRVALACQGHAKKGLLKDLPLAIKLCIISIRLLLCINHTGNPQAFYWSLRNIDFSWILLKLVSLYCRRLVSWSIRLPGGHQSEPHTQPLQPRPSEKFSNRWVSAMGQIIPNDMRIFECKLWKFCQMNTTVEDEGPYP